MLAALITHPGDRHLALQLCNQIRALGGVTNHEALIVAPDGTDMTGIEDVLTDAFGRVDTHFYRDTMKGWPFGANEAAGEAMLHVAANPTLRYHFLMLEPDCIPVSKTWMDYLDTEYRRFGMPILGVRINTVEIDTNRVVGKHTVGVAVYPKNFAQICPLVRGVSQMTNDYQRQNAMPMPWDAYFGPYTAKMTAETTLIQHLSRVRTVDGNGVHWDCASLENALGQVRRDAVLVHGSKDPAFFKALTKNDFTIKPAPKAPVLNIVARAVQPASENLLKSPAIIPSAGGFNSSNEFVPEQLTKEQRREQKSRAKSIRDKERVRKEYQIEAEIETPQWDRACFFHFKKKWQEIKSYAAKNLRIQSFKKTKGELINEIVRVEAEQRKEAWTNALPPVPKPPEPEIPVEDAPLKNVSFAVSSPSHPAVAWTPIDSGPVPQPPPGLSPAQQERMRELIASRQTAGAMP